MLIMLIEAFRFRFGIVVLCYISIMIVWFLAEYFGLYGYTYINYELRAKIRNWFNKRVDNFKKASEVYNYFYS